MAKKPVVPQGDVADHAKQLRHNAPVTDQHSAMLAMAMRNHGTTPAQRAGMMSQAAQYAPADVARCNAMDGDCDDMGDMSGMDY